MNTVPCFRVLILMAPSNKIVSVKIVRDAMWTEKNEKKMRKWQQQQQKKYGKISKMEKLHTILAELNWCHNTLPSSQALKVRQHKQSTAETLFLSLRHTQTHYKFISSTYRRRMPALTNTRKQISTHQVIFVGWQRSSVQPSPPSPPLYVWDLSISHFHLSSIKFQLRRMHTRRKQFVGAKPKLTP